MPLAAGTRLGPHEVLDLVGAGGMGEVYRARDPRLGRDVAIKVLPAEVGADPDRLRRFEQEARAVAALRLTEWLHGPFWRADSALVRHGCGSNGPNGL